jgi:hypothetical protein
MLQTECAVCLRDFEAEDMVSTQHYAVPTLLPSGLHLPVAPGQLRLPPLPPRAANCMTAATVDGDGGSGYLSAHQEQLSRSILF